MRRFKFFPLITIIAISTAQSSNREVIYGEDNRKDIHQVDDQLFLTVAKSTAAMIPKSQIKAIEGREELKITGNRLSDEGVCKSEPFSNQISAAHCSGFLVKENWLVTAGHCMSGSFDCKKYAWVFGFNKKDPQQNEYIVNKNDVYNCKQVLESKNDYITQDDYSLIELDRNVEQRIPLDYRRKGQVETNDPLVVIGHPSGLPTKVADGAWVRSTDPETYFVANLDTYGGNSGSAVFNADSGIVEGILVRGEVDYIFNGNCRVSNICEDDACRGEDVTRIRNISLLK